MKSLKMLKGNWKEVRHWISIKQLDLLELGL